VPQRDAAIYVLGDACLLGEKSYRDIGTTAWTPEGPVGTRPHEAENDFCSETFRGEKGRPSMRGKVVAFLLGGLFALAAASPALASQPPGQLGYEGQPGNQGGGGGQPPGCLGYEGQPGNQGC
jgi:hypothetical protein